MSDGGYSRIEKDFLGNERMVHYDVDGNMLGASDVVREEDGTLRIPNEPAVAAAAPADLPKVEVIEPKPKADVQSGGAIGVGYGKKDTTVQGGRLITYVIATFIASAILTLGVLSIVRSQGSSNSGVRFNTTPTYTPPVQTPQQNTMPQESPRREQDQFPPDPKPRNDQPDPSDQRSTDPAGPDSNPADNHDRIDRSDADPDKIKPEKGGAGNSSDPIDLRGGDGSATDPPKKGDPAKGDPGKGDPDPLRGGNI